MDRTPIAEIRQRTYKSRDAWWTVVVVDPVAVHLVRWVAPYRAVTPNRISLFAFVLGLGAAACFALAEPGWLGLGALLFHLAFVADCVDGKIARLNGTGTAFGAWLDYMLDRVRVVTCTVALVGAQWARTGEDYWLVLGGMIAFLEMFHNLNALEIARVKGGMRRRLANEHEREAEANGVAVGPGPRFVEEVVQEIPRGEDTVEHLAGVDRTVVDLNGEFRSRFGAFVVFRNALRRSRIRPNLVSTIEFAMGCFVVAPLAGALFGSGAAALTVVVVATLVLLFDLAIIYKLYLSTRGFERQYARARRSAEAAEARAARPDADTRVTV